MCVRSPRQAKLKLAHDKAQTAAMFIIVGSCWGVILVKGKGKTLAKSRGQMVIEQKKKIKKDVPLDKVPALILDYLERWAASGDWQA